mgnify:CR=1 FL=1
MSVKSSVIRQTLMGVHFWAVHYVHEIKPKFEVFRYVGFEANTGKYFFQSLRSPKSVIHRNHAQLNHPNFKPFLLVTKDIQAFEESGGRKVANI